MPDTLTETDEWKKVDTHLFIWEPQTSHRAPDTIVVMCAHTLCESEGDGPLEILGVLSQLTSHFSVEFVEIGAAMGGYGEVEQASKVVVVVLSLLNVGIVWLGSQALDLGELDDS